MLGSIASAINSQHGRGNNDVSAHEVVYGQKMDHDFLCSKEEACQCWTVPERLKVTNDLEFTEYACENYIIDDDKICDDDAKVTSLMDCCLLTKGRGVGRVLF